MSHTMTSRVFSSATRLLALLESFARVPYRQVDTLGGQGIMIHFFLILILIHHHHPPRTFTPTLLLPSPKNTPKQVTEKVLFQKKGKNKSYACRDAFPPKHTSPKTNETSDDAHCNACTDYPHIISQCIYRVATISTSYQVLFL